VIDDPLPPAAPAAPVEPANPAGEPPVPAAPEGGAVPPAVAVYSPPNLGYYEVREALGPNPRAPQEEIR